MIPMILVMGIIFFLSHQSGDSLYVPPIPGIDKIVHFGAYFALGAATLYWVNSRGSLVSIWIDSLLTIIICTLYGMSDEFHQSFIPGRCASFADLIADILGAIAVCWAWAFLSIRRNNSRES